jgi:hypothetical protein
MLILNIPLAIVFLILLLEIIIILAGRRVEYGIIRGYGVEEELDRCIEEDVYACMLPKQVLIKTGIKVGDKVEIILRKEGVKTVLYSCGCNNEYFIRINPTMLEMLLGKTEGNIPVAVRVATSTYAYTLFRNFIEAVGGLFFAIWFFGYVLDYEIFGVTVSITRVLDILGSTFIDIGTCSMLLATILFIMILRNPYIDPAYPIEEGFRSLVQRVFASPKEYIEKEGKTPVLITVPHAKGPGGEDYVSYIAYKLARALNAHLLIGGVSRAKMDLNRSEADEHPFRKRIREVLSEKRIKLVIDLHGMRGDEPKIELGSADGKCATKETLGILKEYIESVGFRVDVDKKFKGAKGGTVITTFCDPPNREAVQIEISYYIRRNKELRLKLVDALINAVKKLLEKE